MIRLDGGDSQRSSTFVRQEVDCKASVLFARKHTGASKQCIMNRVGVYQHVMAEEFDIDDVELVDVFHMLADVLCHIGYLGCFTKDQVARSSGCDSAGNVWSKGELMIVPTDLKL